MFVAILFFATSLAFAGKGKGKDKDGGGGSQALRIVAAEPDLEAGTLLITGFNFSTGSSFDGVVELFFPPDAEEVPAVLTVISFDPAVPPDNPGRAATRRHRGFPRYLRFASAQRGRLWR